MKQKLRKEAKEQRFSETGVQEKSEKIIETLFKSPEYIKAKKVLFYVSIGKEVNTRQAIDMSIGEKKVFIPYIVGKDIEISEISSLSETVPGSFGIPEPILKNPLPIREIDLIIVPGIAFDDLGNRIGYGMGYYDKLISKSSAPCIALAYESQIYPMIPVEEHDKRVDKIITEKKVIDCKSSEEAY